MAHLRFPIEEYESACLMVMKSWIRRGSSLAVIEELAYRPSYRSRLNFLGWSFEDCYRKAQIQIGQKKTDSAQSQLDGETLDCP